MDWPRFSEEDDHPHGAVGAAVVRRVRSCQPSGTAVAATSWSRSGRCCSRSTPGSRGSSRPPASRRPRSRRCAAPAPRSCCSWSCSLAASGCTLPRRPREIVRLVGFGITGVALVQWFYFVAIARLPVGIALMLQFTAPVLVALWVRFVYREPVRSRIWLGIACSLGGLALVAEVWSGLALDGIGVLAGLGRVGVACDVLPDRRAQREPRLAAARRSPRRSSSPASSGTSSSPATRVFDTDLTTPRRAWRQPVESARPRVGAAGR